MKSGTVWNPWHGCHKISAGCQNCYMYRRDAEFGRDSSIVQKTASFRLPVQYKRNGGFKLQDKEVFACMTSDFFVEEADAWRAEAWGMIHRRQDVHFHIITKRINRFTVCLPANWGNGYDNVTICTTCENQSTADSRLPLFLELPILHREIICEPLLEEIHLSNYLASGKIEYLTCGGESGDNARICKYDWVLSLREQCMQHQVSFWFKQTGTRFIKDRKLYQIPREQQMSQAEKAGIDLSF